MADSGAPNEMMFCHHCMHRWRKTSDVLTCPICESDFTEILTEDEDEDDGLDPAAAEPPSPRSRRPTPMHPFDFPRHTHRLDPFNPFDQHDPWDGNPNVTRYEIRQGPGSLTFTTSSYRRSARSPPFNQDPMTDVNPNFYQMLNTLLAPPTPNRRGPVLAGGFFNPRATDPMNDDPMAFGGRRTYATNGRQHPRGAGDPVAELEGLLGLLVGLQNPERAGTPGPPGATAAFGPFGLLSSLINPANAAHGDAVFTQEALDRVISQLMEQNAGSNAPGPASAAAIHSLPKKKVDKGMLGGEEKGECSICMDAVEIGSEVAELPCKHWFHYECVSSWLREHDTCPHCRKSITPQRDPEAPAPTTATTSRYPRHPRSNLATHLPGHHSPISRPSDSTRNQSSHSLPGSFPEQDPPDDTLQDERSSGRAHERHGSGSSSRSSRRHRDERRPSGRDSGDHSGGGFTGWVRNHLRGAH